MIGLHDPDINYLDSKNVLRCIKSGWISPSGKYNNLLSKKISKYTNIKYILPTVSGTSSLQLSIASLEPCKNSEILVPDISFIASSNAIIYNNCNPVFIGIDNNFLISEKKLEKFLREKTFFLNGYTYNLKTKKKIIALIIVNTFGNLVDIKKIKKILKKRNILIIEDAAESLGSFHKYNNKKFHSGSFSDISCFSFNTNKIITSGGGGFLGTNNKKLYQKALHLSTQAKSDDIFFKHDELGYNIKLPSFNAALLIKQINNINEILKKKENVKKFYQNKIKKLNNILFIDYNHNCTPNHWLNLIKLNNRKKQEKKIVKYFFKNKIIIRPIWYPLSKQKLNTKFQSFMTEDTNEIIKNIFCLPSSSILKKKELNKVFQIIKKINNFK